jgi:hypothetical protein
VGEALLPGVPPLFGFHKGEEDIVDACQVALTFGFEPVEDLRVEPHAYRYFPSDVAQPYQARQLLGSQARDVAEIDV